VTNFHVRPAIQEDEPVLWQMLFEAAHLGDEGHTSVQIAKDRSDLAHYVAGWIRPGDLGVVAEIDHTEPIGAAWVRLLKADDPGYGYVDDATPELAIGVHRDYRGSGVGTAMLARLIDMAKEHYPALSLSTRAANAPAVRLYKRMGFKKVSGSEVTNWAGGLSYNMKLDLVVGR
jgi:ribosomal protein S18 acetylase RimI-like enzyme